MLFECGRFQRHQYDRTTVLYCFLLCWCSVSKLVDTNRATVGCTVPVTYLRSHHSCEKQGVGAKHFQEIFLDHHGAKWLVSAVAIGRRHQSTECSSIHSAFCSGTSDPVRQAADSILWHPFLGNFFTEAVPRAATLAIRFGLQQVFYLRADF